MSHPEIVLCTDSDKEKKLCLTLVDSSLMMQYLLFSAGNCFTIFNLCTFLQQKKLKQVYRVYPFVYKFFFQQRLTKFITFFSV